jgi:hypothetical protein
VQDAVWVTCNRGARCSQELCSRNRRLEEADWATSLPFIHQTFETTARTPQIVIIREEGWRAGARGASECRKAVVTQPGVHILSARM